MIVLLLSSAQAVVLFLFGCDLVVCCRSSCCTLITLIFNLLSLSFPHSFCTGMDLSFLDFGVDGISELGNSPAALRTLCGNAQCSDIQEQVREGGITSCING